MQNMAFNLNHTASWAVAVLACVYTYHTNIGDPNA